MICFVTVVKSSKAPTGIEHFFFGKPRLVAKSSVMKLADEQVSRRARPRINWFLLLYTGIRALVINWLVGARRNEEKVFCSITVGIASQFSGGALGHFES